MNQWNGLHGRAGALPTRPCRDSNASSLSSTGLLGHEPHRRYAPRAVKPCGALDDRPQRTLDPLNDNGAVVPRGTAPLKTNDERGQALRALQFGQYPQIGGRTVASMVTVRPLDQSREYTQLRYQSLEFDIDLPRRMFTVQPLQSR